MSAHRRHERGAASIWALLLTALAFTGLLGLIVDGGHAIDDRLDAARTAAQAARLGADQLATGAVRSGRDDVNAAAAAVAVRGYLADAGRTGTVRVHGDQVTVTITDTSRPRILGVLGIDSFPVRESQTARGVTGEDQR